MWTASLHILLPHYQREPALIEGQIALIVTKAVGVAGAGHEFISKIAEFETLFHQAIAVDFGFAVGVEFGQDAAVFAQDVVDVADEIGSVAVQPVVERAATLVGAELLICPAFDLFATFYASVFHGRWGGAKSVVFQLECILGSQLDLVFAHQRLEARHGIAPIGDDLHALFQRQFRFL